MIIACDVDDVVADLISEWVRRYNERWNDCLTPADIKGWDLSQFVKPECGRKVYEILGDKDLYDDIEPFPGALETVARLRDYGRVIFVTACGGPTRDPKYAWLREHGFLGKDQHADYITAKDKWLIRAHVLIDDGVHNVEPFSEGSGTGLLVPRPHNMGVSIQRGIRLTGFEEAPEVVEWLARKDD